MTNWIYWLLLTALTGNPILAAVLVLVGWWVFDRFTFRVLPSPWRRVRKFLRVGTLERMLEHNPHDRRARLELAEARIERGQYARALELLKPNLEAGEDDAQHLVAMGIACLGAGHVDQGEAFLTHAQEADPNYRMGEIELERGRWRLRRGDVKGAQEALAKFVAARPGTVEGRVLWAQALEKAGDDASGALKREEAWHEYRLAPAFQRRIERFWAWRARPARPILYAALVALAALGFARLVAPSVKQWAESRQGSSYVLPEE